MSKTSFRQNTNCVVRKWLHGASNVAHI